MFFLRVFRNHAPHFSPFLFLRPNFFLIGCETQLSELLEYSTPRNTTIILPCRRRVLGADDRHQHAAALGAGGRGDPGQPGHLHANRQGLAVRVHRFDGHLGERLPQGGVAGAHGRDHVDTTRPATCLCRRTGGGGWGRRRGRVSVSLIASMVSYF